MNARRLHFKQRVSISAHETGDVIWLTGQASEKYELSPEVVRATAELGAAVEDGSAFELIRLPDVKRLAWAAGATSVSKFAIVRQTRRYAAWIDDRDTTLRLVDVTRPEVLCLSWLSLRDGMAITIGEHALYLATNQVTIVPLAELVSLFDAPGATTLGFHDEYRSHDPVTLDRARDQTEHLTVEVRREADPLPGGLQRPEPPQRTAELTGLLEQLAETPDPVTSTVLVDLWQDAGEPYAPLFARMIAGDTEAREEALGLLGRFLGRIQYEGGLPRKAWLAANAPDDSQLTEMIVSDQRLGLFVSLLAEYQADTALYTKLVCSPRAIGLREVHVPDAKFLKALVAAGKSQLTALRGVKFTTKETIETLADPTFDRVLEISVIVDWKFAAKQLEWLARDEAGFWGRVPRQLTLVEKNQEEANLVGVVRSAWPKLPLAGITAGTLTLSR